MKKIRTKIIAVLILTVFIPLVPISLVVLNLIQRSYQIGVHPQIESALENGVYFSKSLYDIQRTHLLKSLELMGRSLSSSYQIPRTQGELFDSAGFDTLYWEFRALALLDKEGDVLAEANYQTSEQLVFDRRILKELQLQPQKGIVISDRQNNVYSAIVEMPQDRFLVLQAAMKPTFMSASDHLLRVHQIYQSLDLARDSLIKSFLYTFLFIAGILLVLVVLAGIWMSSRITAPISVLVEGTSELGKGNLDFRLPEDNGRDELSQLVREFNRMARQLKTNQERMLYLEKMSAWQQMARKIAHELKNPLTPIQLTIQQLVDKYPEDNEEYFKLLKECSGIIQEEIGSLRRLVTEFSEFGRLPQPSPVKANLNELIREVSGLYGSRIELRLDDHLKSTVFDPDRMRRVLVNLIENAIQADAAEHPIIISTQLEDAQIIVKVKDRGKGIDPQLLPRIFEPYVSGKKEGTGLGLATTRLFIEEQQGYIRVESHPGEGSEFIIELPLETDKNLRNHEYTDR
jgi:nitrogen fixation/metabolism regulation signal transduction histidine kinase